MVKKLKLGKNKSKVLGDVRIAKTRKVHNKFVLTIGDEGAILAHYEKGKLENRIFVDSPYSQETNLIKKLFRAYPSTPIYMLADVVEQNYIQQTLPPVSSMAVKKQVKRRMAKELQKNDFNNYLPLGRQKTGRKDWDFLFISLANSDPFAKWFEFVMEQDNEFMGVYLLPVESQKFLSELSKSSINNSKKEWELFVLHNKVGGFRIVALKNGKIIFTRLAQQLIGNNIPDVIVGNLEQEISNTIEYLKRLGFKSEGDSKITIISGTEILQRIDKKALGFGVAETYSPYQAAEKLGLQNSLDESDKFADIVATTFFAASPKPVLKFSSPLTTTLDNLKSYIKLVYVAGLIIFLGIIGLLVADYLAYEKMLTEKERTEITLKKGEQNISEVKQKYAELPEDANKMIDILLLNKNFSRSKELALQVIEQTTKIFSQNQKITSIKLEFSEPTEIKSGELLQADEYNIYSSRSSRGMGISRTGEPDMGFKLFDAKPEEEGREVPKDKLFVHGFNITISFKFNFLEKNLDLVSEISDRFLEEAKAKLPKYKIEYTSAPKAPDFDKVDEVTLDTQQTEDKTVALESTIKITGEISEKKEANN